ncbi:MAG: ferrochelatase [Polyangiales bacterium]
MDQPFPADVGVLLLGHGSVERPEDIPAFVQAIRRGRPTPQSIVDEVTHRWKAIGGSPLQAIVERQARALEARLGAPVATASRLWHPYAKDVVPALVARGAKRIVSVPLAPYSVPIYHATAKAACDAAGVACIPCAPWGTTPALIDVFAAMARSALGRIPEAERARTHLVLSAHTLPLAIVAAGDPYEQQVRATAAAVVAALEFPASRAHVAFQSQGMDGGAWLGPDLPATYAAIAEAGGGAAVTCALGFLADHTEVLYDLDVEAKSLAEARGLRFERAPSPNDAPRMIDALERVARDALAAV